MSDECQMIMSSTGPIQEKIAVQGFNFSERYACFVCFVWSEMK